MNSIKIMSDSEKSCRKLQFLVDYMSDQFGVEVETGFESVVELRKIVDTLETRIDSKIGFKSHLFEVFDENTRQFVKIPKRSQLIPDLSRIRVSAKPQEPFKCFVHFYDINKKKSTFEVVIDKCYEQIENYQKIMDKCWEVSGLSLPTDFTFEVYDEKSNKFFKLDKSQPNIDNGSIIRICCLNNETEPKTNEPAIKILSRKTSEAELGSDSMNETIIKGINKLVIDDKKRNHDRPQTDSLVKSEDKVSDDKKSVDRKKSSDESSTSSASSPQSSSFDSTEDMNDYYLSLSVCQCLTSSKHTFKEPTLFWKSVSNKLVNEYKLNVMDENECQTRFEELLQLYINVLKTAKDSIEANDVFKCFGIFNTIDLNLFLTPNIYQLIVELRYKLWNGVKHKSSPMRRPEGLASPSVPYYCYGLTQNQVNYLAYYGYYPINMYPNHHYYPRAPDNYYNDFRPNENLQSLVKTEFIDEIALRQRLIDSSSVEEQIATFRGRVLFTEKDFKKRSELKAILQSILNDNGFDCVLHFFGSTDNSLGFRNSDIDLFVELNKEKNFAKSLDFATAVHYLRQIRDCLQRSLRIPIGEPVESRRCPIIKLDFTCITANKANKALALMKLGISCDISITNGLGVINTKLIRFYAQYDRRFQELAIILKFWAKKNGLIDGLNGFTSYALIQLLIFFCQQLNPPLLPTVDQLRRLESKEAPLVIDDRECSFCAETSAVAKSQNTETVLQLLAKFFKFYSDFDFTTQVVRPKTGASVHKKAIKDLKLMHSQKKLSDVIGFNVTPFCCIEDPFNLEHNLTSGLKVEYFDKFLEYVKHIALGVDTIFIETKPKSEDKTQSSPDWGISKIITKWDPTPDGYQPLTGRHVFYSRVKHILQSVDTNTNRLVSDLLKEYYELVQFCLERLFRCRPKITINREITGQVFPFAQFSVHTTGINAKIFDSTERNAIKKKLKSGKRKTSKQRIDREVHITQQLITDYKDKDVSQCEAEFNVGLVCYARPSAPCIELKINEVNAKECNVRPTLKEVFDLIPKILEERSK